MGEGLAGWSVDYGHWDGGLTDCMKRVGGNPQIDPDYAVRLLSANALRFCDPQLQQRIEPLVRAQRMLDVPRGGQPGGSATGGSCEVTALTAGQ